MTYEQKLEALNSLAGMGRLVMREPGDWCCSHQVDIKDRYVLIGGCGNGATPEAAVLDQWERLTTRLEPHQHIVTRSPTHRRVRWNGFMWADVPAEEKQEG